MGANCFFNAEGTIKRPFASTLHSYVPIKFTTVKYCRAKYIENYTTIYHFLPQC